MKKLTLDLNKWRCGGESSLPRTKLGKGDTALLNDNGYMCCLGQFAIQLGAEKEEIVCKEYPSNLKRRFPLISREHPSKNIVSTKFSIKAMQINDDYNTTILQKIKRLRNLLKSKGYSLIVKNSTP